VLFFLCQAERGFQEHWLFFFFFFFFSRGGVFFFFFLTQTLVDYIHECS